MLQPLNDTIGLHVSSITFIKISIFIKLLTIILPFYFKSQFAVL